MLKSSQITMPKIGFSGSDAVVYDDIQAGASRLTRPGGSDPTWRTYNLGIGGGVAYSVLGFALNQYGDIWIQTPHAMKLNTVLDNHLHWIIPSESIGDKIKFEIAVAAAGIGDTFAAPAGSPYSAEVTLVGGEASKHSVLDIGDIPAVNTTVSTAYAIQLKRIAASSNDYAPEVYMIFNDSHAQLDTPGSIAEGSKV